YREAYKPLLPDINVIEYNNLDDIPQITTKTAAVILETVQGEAGIRIPDIQWIKAIRKRCDETGTLLILEEIQTAFGRTGKLFSFENFGSVPYIILLGSALGAGMPIGAFVADKNVMNVITSNPMLGDSTTFGVHPVCGAAALASIDAILEENLMTSVPHKAE